MPNRYIRDALLDSERYHNLSSDSVRLLFVELVLSADDFGLVPIGTMYLRRRCAAAASKPNEAIVKMISELADSDMVRTYAISSTAYAFIPRNGFTIRATKPKYPLPTKEAGTGFNELMELAQKRRAFAPQTPDKRTANAQQMRNRRSANAADNDFDNDFDNDSAPRKATRRRGQRLPAGWTCTGEYLAAARSIAPHWNESRIQRAADEFRDYWVSATKHADKLDWLATWRNRVRELVDREPPRPAPQPLRQRADEI